MNVKSNKASFTPLSNFTGAFLIAENMLSPYVFPVFHFLNSAKEHKAG